MSTTYNTLFIGKVLLHFPRLASTNEYALQLLSNSKPSEGTAISTDNQYQGRGQIGSSWESQAYKNISVSLIFYPEFLPVSQQFCLNLATSLGVLECISGFCQGKISIKWPNDIYIGKRKTAGILIQNQLAHSMLRSSVVGIGINVNQTEFRSDAPNPTSLKLETGFDLPLEEIQSRLFWHIEKRYLQLRSGKADQLKNDYLTHLFQIGVEAVYQRADSTCFRGRITDITGTGKLVIQHEQKSECFDLKEIKFIL